MACDGSEGAVRFLSDRDLLLGAASDALAPRVGRPLERAVAQEHAVQARVLAGTGAHLDSATGEFGADAWRKARGLAVEALAARDQVGQVDRLLQRQVPVDQADQGLGDRKSP